MSSQLKNILVFGGTGTIGRFITNALLNSRSSFDRVAIFTSPSTIQNKASLLQEWKARGLEVISGDLSQEEEVLNAYRGFDTVISAVGRNALASQINLIHLAESAPNIKRFFPSEYGTDIEYGPQSASEKPHQLKLKVRAYIRDQIKRLEYTYLVTGPYADMYFKLLTSAPTAGGWDVKQKMSVLLGDGEGMVSLTTMKDVGRLLVAALLHPDASRNRALKVNSFTITPNAIQKEFEKQTGAAWNVTYTPLEELNHLEQEAWDKQNFFATVYTLRRIWAEGGTLYKERDNDDIQAPPMQTLEESVAHFINSQSAN